MKHGAITRAVLVVLLALGHNASAAETITRNVVRIADGDTLTLLADRQQIKVRLSEIDAPGEGPTLRDQGQAGTEPAGVRQDGSSRDQGQEQVQADARASVRRHRRADGRR